MKRIKPGRMPFFAMILLLALALAGCGGGSNSPQASTGSSTPSGAAASAPASASAPPAASAPTLTPASVPTPAPASSPTPASTPAVQNASGTVQGVTGGSTVTSPTAVTIYGSLYGGSLDKPQSRLIIPVIALGSETLPAPSPLVLDTGSAGMIIDAQDVFPADMVSTNGFVFPPGQNTLSYHGIVVTNVQATKVYSNGGQTDYGNIGFATVKFGGQGELTTNLMPVLFTYKALGSNGQLLQFPQHGVLGINSYAGPVLAPGVTSSDSLNICSLQSITASGCDFVSVLRYLNYAPGVNAGFSLGNANLDSNCLISPTMSGCTLQPALTVGLSAADEQTYASTPVTCPQGSSRLLKYPSSNARSFL